jgi:hypothetical protein
VRHLLPLAAALGDQIQRFSSYFGIAAIVGLGVLALLYFTQAREVKRLREWAGRAPERDAELAQRVQAGAQRRVVAQPVPTPAAAAQPGGPQTAAAQQADAARKAAAAAVMQKLQPSGAGAAPVAGPPGQLARPVPSDGSPGTVPAPGTPPETAGPASGGLPAGAAGAKSAAAGPPSAETTGPGSASGGVAPAGTGGSPKSGATSAGGESAGRPGAAASASAPGGASGATAGSPAMPASGAGGAPAPAAPRRPAATGGAATAAAAARKAATPSRSPVFDNGGAAQDTHESSAARPAPLPELPRRPSRTASGAPPAGDDRGRHRGRRRVGLVLGGVAAAVAVGVAAVLLLAPASDKPPAGSSLAGGAAPAGTSPASSTKVDRKATQVAVLNGTTQTGLARGVGNKLQDRGFTILSVGDNADQQIATTTVSYAVGGEPAARVIARIVGVAAAAVKPIDTNTATAVAPEANVVVTVGNDRSSAG